MIEQIFLLFVIFQLKHFVADYPLQGKYMLGKFKPTGWFLPLASHTLVHGVFTFAIVLMFSGNPILALSLASLDFSTHFIMDRIKASPKLLGRIKDFYDKRFWWILGFDQLVHHLSDTLVVYILIRYLF